MMYENFRHTHGSGAGAGPIANGHKKVRHSSSNGSLKTGSKVNLSKSQGMASSNTKNWEPDVQMLFSTAQWLKIHGLKRHKLDLGQILPSIGFRHSDDYVRPLKKPVRARYCSGLFTQVPYRDGTVFNLTTNKEKLQTIESQLKQVISLYKKRLEWLTTESRRVFGVVEERCVCIVLDIDATSDSQFDIYLHALLQVLKEQIVFLAKFNLIRATLNMECWQQEAVCVTLDSLEGALDWIWKLNRTSARSSTCTVEAVMKALSDQHIEAVYLFSEGDASVEAQELLRRKVQDSRVPLHIVSLNCATPSTITFLKGICKATKGRFHAFSVADEYEDAFDSFQKTMETEASGQPRGRGRGDGMPTVKLGVGLREDVITLWEELDEARNTMAEIQALQCEMKDPKSTPVSTMPPPGQNETGKENQRSKSELYMSSRGWLKRHGLSPKKLGFYDLLQTLAFKHCDGVVDIQTAPAINGSSDAIVRPKLVNARYCDKFAHVRWKDGKIMHVHVSGPIHRNFEQRMLSALDSYRKRMEWLQQGSRELFGTIIEDQAVILIDTSASMASRLFLVKDKLYRLMQEQLRHKIKFNLIKFDSRVQAWRDRLVDCNTHNLDNAWQWVKGLSTGGSTNTLAALKLALTDSQCQAIYLLTDGRPDQPPSSILAQVHLLNPVPMHTISFNCADTEANQFLCQLAAETGGRFHYFSEDGYDVDGPKPFESEDLRLLREEIDRGLADLKKVAMIRNECAQLDWYGSNTGRCSKNHPRSVSQPKRPMSASPNRAAIPSPPSSKRQRPSSARTRAHSARARPASARLSHSSYKDYLVTSASQEIEQSALVAARRTPPQARETKTSLMRLNMTRSKSSEWVLPETRQYLARAANVHRKNPNGKMKTKKTKKRRQEDEEDLDIPVKKWLKKNGLVARKLTILDALAPTLIPHTTKYIPILDKHVLSKVFDQVLPLAHTSGSNRDEVHLVNPQGVNLKAYETKLKNVIQEYTRHLDEFVFVALSDEERIKYPEDELPSFLNNKESMMSDLEKQGWPLPKEDIVLLEKEIEQAQVFLRQSEDLRKTSEEAAREIAQQQRKAREEAENKRIEQIMRKKVNKDSQTPAPLPGNKYRLRHHKVLARSEVDGFYYQGLVSRCLNSRYVEVDFNDFDRQVVPVRYVIPVEGARPCPTLKVGDCVLVKTLVPREDEDDVIEDTVHCYVPGIIQVAPLRKSTATKCFTILRFNGKKITSLRGDLVKISKARYTFACRYIRDALLSAYRSTSPFGFYPRNTREEINSKEDDGGEDEDNKVERPHSQARSRSSKSTGSGGSRSRSSSGERSLSPTQPERKSPRSSSGDRSPSPPRSGRSSRPSSAREKLEKWKDELEEKHSSQLKELKDELLAEQEKQQRQQEDLEEKQRALQDKQQDLMQAQLDEQKSRASAMQEEQRRLQQQQQDLLNKQRDQQEQLLQHQFNQTQALHLQHQQLIQHLASSAQANREKAKDTKSPRGAVSPAVSSATSSPRSSRRSSSSVSPGRSSKGSPRESQRGSPVSPKGSSKGSPVSPKGSSKGSAVSPRGSKKGSAVSPKESPRGSRSNSAGSSKKSSRPSSVKADSEKDNENDVRKDGSSSDSDSPSLSSSSSSSSDEAEVEVAVDEVDGEVGAEPEPEDESPNLQFHLSSPGNEACLLTKGSHGLLISRLPPDEDPAVETRPIPKKVEVGEEVLARWSDDGWYYRGTVRQDCGDGSYFIEDSLGDLEQIYRSDIITDADDADNVINNGDAVVGLHPSFPFSYAPGVVMDIEEENLFQVRHYDGMESLVPRDEVYLLPAEKFESDCQYILNCEQSLVGQAVVARNDEDGLFHLGKVRERVGNGRQYIIEWAEQSLQLQSYGYIFGAHTKRHPLVIGDRVLALVDPATYVYMPGWITGSNGRRLCIKFCNGKSSSQVDPLQCFRLACDYYDRIVDHYNKKRKEKR